MYKMFIKCVKWVLKYPLSKFRRLYYYVRRYPYIKSVKGKLDNDTTIICSNCFAGRLYQDLKISYRSPFAGLFFFADDYVALLSDLEVLLKRRLVFISIEQSQYEIAKRKFSTRPHWYPIGVIDGTNIEIHFLHYKTIAEVESKWYRRIERMNFQKLLVIGMEQNEPSIEAKKNFAKLPYKNKIYYCVNENFQDSSMVYVKEFRGNNECLNPYIYAHVYYKYLVKHLSKLNLD